MEGNVVIVLQIVFIVKLCVLTASAVPLLINKGGWLRFTNDFPFIFNTWWIKYASPHSVHMYKLHKVTLICVFVLLFYIFLAVVWAQTVSQSLE